MLIEFRVANHRSLRDEQALTMEATRMGDAADSRLRVVAGHPEPLLPVAVLYGANASGKSNVLSALSYMRDAVVNSHRLWSPDGHVPRTPFAWGSFSAQPSVFECMVVLGGVRHEYGFVVDDAGIVEEWLYAWPNGRRQIWLERERSTFKFGEHLKGENRLVEQVTRTNALFLAAAVQHRHEQLLPLYRWFASTSVVRARRHERWMTKRAELWLQQTIDGSGAGDRGDVDAATDNEAALAGMREFLRRADVGIVDVQIRNLPDALGGERQVMLRHSHTGGEAWLPLEEESTGTRAIFQIAPAVLYSLKNGTALVIDELESSLHPLLAMHIVQMFNDPQTNPLHAQLICATHDTNLLGTTAHEPVLRRDQVWFTEKDGEGATRLYPLTNYKPRKAENLERGYLQGRYGAVPFLGDPHWVQGG